MNILYVESVSALWLALGNPQLLEVNVRSIERGALAATDRALLPSEIIHLTHLDLLASRCVELRVQVPAESRLCQARRLEM